MQKKLSHLLIAAAVLAAGGAHAGAPPANGKANNKANNKANEAATARYFAKLAAGSEPLLAELTMFFNQMPKGGDLHHHYSGAIYAEQYVQWLDLQNLCVSKQTYRIETNRTVVEAERAKPAAERACLSSGDVFANDVYYRELLQRWSVKDLRNHGGAGLPPDEAFFQTFGYFGPVSGANAHEGLLELKKRAIGEHVGYIETMFLLAPSSADARFDQQALRDGIDEAALTVLMRDWMAVLESDPRFTGELDNYVDRIASAAAGIDDAEFTMRYQAYVLRLLAPSQVFSSMLAGFKAASRNPLIVGVNIVGQESATVPMRDYRLHMQMFRFLKTRYPNVKLALHAGELALGDVPPDGLKFHIDAALGVGGADRIGHGIDLAHEANAPAIMKTMREKDIAVEINLTSNELINGVQGGAHPVTLYRKYGVPFVISTDDAGVARGDLAQEYVLFASRYRPAYAEIKKLSYNGLRYAFLPAREKQRLTAQLDSRFAAFEAQTAALSASAASTR